MVKLPETVTPEQFQQIAPLLIRAILTEGKGGWEGQIDELSWSIADGEITGQFSDGPGVFGYRLWQERGQWQRSFQPISGVKDLEVPEFELPTQQPDAVDILTAKLREQAGPIIDGWTDQIRDLLEGSGDLPEFAAKLYDLFPDLEGEVLADLMAQAQMAASFAGAYEAQEGE